jgi:hypothetical protein
MSVEQASPSGSSDRSFPTFDRLRDASSESVQAESSKSAETKDERSDFRSPPKPDRVLRRTPNGHQTSRSYGNETSNNEAVTPTKSRTSGGFLLDPTGIPSRLAFLPRSKRDSPTDKGKSRRDRSGLIIHKRTNRHSHRSSIGSSPLATKVSTFEDDADARTGSSAQHGDLGRSVISGSSNTNSHIVQDDSHNMGTGSGSPGIGYDTDPMQIVNMALSLSEGRRRQMSGIRLTSGDPGIRRSTSTGHGINPQTVRPQKSLGLYLNSQRQLSRNISPQAQAHHQSTPMKMYKPTEISGSHLQPGATDAVDVNLENGPYDVSDATFTRVQNAKDHFELLYEHRRLLPHLPPLRGLAQALRSSEVEGRTYNPLQYARNRKVRFQEKKPIEGDVEGWHDVQQVHAWVNAIIEGHTERRTDPDECIRLPELPHLHTEAIQENRDPMKVNSPSSTAVKRDTNQNTKPRRPRSDWVVSPGDLLADVYWLEQGLNKTKIEDRDGNKIYPWDTELKFTGWRNRTPAHGQGRQESSPPPEAGEINKPKVSSTPAPPELPTFLSTGRKGKRRGRARRRETKPRTDTDSEKSDSESQKRRKHLRKSILRTLSRSSASDSDDEKDSRELSKKGKLVTEGRALDHYLRKMLDQDARHFSRPSAAAKPQSVERSRSTTKDHAGHDSRISSSRERASSKKRRASDHRPGSFRDSFSKTHQSRPSQDIERPARSSLEYDTTAPSSPSIHQFPGIAINLSAPPSRSPSPTKKGLHSRINPFRDRNQSKQRNGIDAADFADPSSSLSLQPKSSEKENEASVFITGSRGTSPMTKTSTRTSDIIATPSDSQRTHSTTSKVSAKCPSPPDVPARFRGIFKGGRIAELVGNEVSRVGDFIWKRDPPSATRTSSSTSSAKSQHGSDTEETFAKGNTLKKLPQPHSGRTSSSAERTGKDISAGQLRSAFGDKPSYFMSNLPTFTSPFQKDREVQEERDRAPLLTPETSPPDAERLSDHISRAAAHLRSVSKSSRLNRLAPPKLNISRSGSPAGSPQSRRESFDFDNSLSLVRTTHASRGLNDALTRRQGGRPVTGLTRLNASNSGANSTRNWRLSPRHESTDHASMTITKKDIARARALLLSSGAKAREISLRARLIRPQTPQFLLDTVQSHSPETLEALRVSRKEEHVLAARNLVSSLTHQTATFRTSMDHFTSTTSPTLHTTLQALDDLVENTLTPRVRAAADESGELSMKLTTTSTLAVKGLNDVIEGAMRRRRRGPVRWLRRFGYGIVEWLVVGVLWGIWLMVSLVNVVVGIGRGSYRALRWLFWLD